MPIPSRNSIAAFASASSILERAKPTWIRIQSPGWRSSSESSSMLIARLTPLTLTLARSGWPVRSSMISPGIPRHIAVSHRDRFEDEVVTGNGDEFDGGTVGDAAGRDQFEAHREGRLGHAVHRADPYLHMGDRAPGRALLDGVQERLAESDLVHYMLLIRRYRRMSGRASTTRKTSPARQAALRS